LFPPLHQADRRDEAIGKDRIVRVLEAGIQRMQRETGIGARFEDDSIT